MVLVCPSNCGSRTFTESTAVEALAHVVAAESVMSLSFLANAWTSSMCLLITRVSARLKPVRCVPPSCVLMLFTNEKTFSL